MNDDLPFDESTLSAEDLATLRAFDAIESWETFPSSTSTTPSSLRESGASYSNVDDILSIFLTEVEEDIASMLNALQKVEQEGYTQPAHFVPLRRLGHKMRGTAGEMGYPTMSEIASSIEIIAEQVIYHMLQPGIGSKGISSAIDVLESFLYKLVQDGQEPANMLADLQSLLSLYTQLSIDLNQPVHEDLAQLSSSAQPKAELLAKTADQASSPPSLQSPARFPASSASVYSQGPQISSSRSAAIRTRTYSPDTLIFHAEKLLIQHAAIEHAYKQVEIAFQDLQAAQDRFRRAETLFSISQMQGHSSPLPVDFTSSSLITRIFDTASLRDPAQSRLSKEGGTQYAPQQHSSIWDELDIERYTERDMLLHSLHEATTNVDLCSTRLKHAHAALQRLQHDYMIYATSVRHDALLMRSVPLGTIIPQMREVVMTSMLAREHRVDFEVIGDDVEVDQELLSSLAPLLENLLRTSINNATPSAKQPSSSPQSDSVWLHANTLNHEVALEVGFSMPVGGGILQTLRKQFRPLYGSISLTRNRMGGLSFFLRFPRFRGLLQCLLVRVADQRLLIPLSHVQHVGYTERSDDSFYSLSSLLNIPTALTPQGLQRAIHQVVFLQVPGVDTQQEPLKILVDEIIDQIEAMVRPLAPHLASSGITGSTIDGQGNVLLLLDIAGLVNEYARKTAESLPQQKMARSVKVLVVEDSTSFRNSITHTLSRASYQVTEAHDGLEALELLKLVTSTPDILLLDIEMPFLTGYDLLDILRQDARFSAMKIIMLTSRVSEKHEQRATKLGAHAYLTKPSPPEELLSTIQRLLPSENSIH